MGTNENILFVVHNAVAYDITDFADGMAYKDPPNVGRELLIPAGVRLRVVSVTEPSPGNYRIVLEFISGGAL